MCGVKMKLSLPFFCIALLGVGIMPAAAAGPRSFSEGTNLDQTEAEPAIALDPSLVNPSKEDDRTQWWAIASVIDRQKPIEQKPLSESEELEVKLPEENLDQKPNSDLTVAPEYNSDRPASTPNIEPTAPPKEPTAEIPKLDEIEQPNTNVEGLFQRSQASFTFSENVQISQSVIQVTGVQLNPTPAGLEVILETAGQVLRANTRTEGKTLNAEISNAQLALPSGEEFKAENPFEGITSVTVTNVDGNSIRISITGKERLPIADVIRSVSGLTLSVTADEEINIRVTARQATPYRVPNASSATRTDTPIRDIPQSIQVIPQEVIKDQQITRLEEALSNVSGVTFRGVVGGRGTEFDIRGFSNAPVLRDGFRRYGSFQSFPEVANLDRVEVLKGPASILYGEIQPGGLVNLVSKQPLAEPLYEAELQLGNQTFVRSRFDISGPLTSDRSVLYRLNGLFQTIESFRDYNQQDRRLFIAPTLTWRISDRADLTVSLEYTDDQRPANYGLFALGDRVADVPRNRISNNPRDKIEDKYFNVGYNFEYRFSENWKLRNAFRYSSYDYDFSVIALPFFVNEETKTVTRFFASQDGQDKNYSLQTNMVGEFATGSIDHTLLFGVDLSHNDERIVSVGDFVTPIPLDIFNPDYGKIPTPEEDSLAVFGGNDRETNRVGIYVQDQISIFDNLKLLAGIRYDTVEQKTVNIPGSNIASGEQTQNYDAFTPRLGIVYQPIPELSLYASYSRSFNPNSARTVSGNVLEPERGKGYEIGVKTELIDRRLLATLAYFDITKQNVAVTDPNNPLFSIATGEQRSRGVELDISGQILPGWNVIASYAYIDAEVTADTNSDVVGSRLPGVPKHSASLWTTYQLQSGDLQGLGIGVGFNYVGERKGGLPNSYKVDSYLVSNAALFYERDNLRFAINIKNLFNINYIVGSPSSSENLPGEPLTVIGSFTIQF
ncbi:ferrichrome-iron receptor [Oscillatoriales cyanobacterium USR001]|nr:ferrichrome-iron receptor [Oscillatoriales cyanobacterium USR001]